MKINFSKYEKTEIEGRPVIQYEITHRKQILTKGTILLNSGTQFIKTQKLGIINDFVNAFPKVSKKEVMFAFSKVDEEIAAIYKTTYPHGGSRKGTGRPKGTVKNTGRMAHFTKAITQEEKEYLEKCLSDFRQSNKNKKLIRLDNIGQLGHCF